VRANFIPHKAVATIHEHYDLDMKLGEGTYGSVHRCKVRKTGLDRAVKMILKTSVKDMVIFRKEIEIMKLLDHPNIVKLFETFEERDRLYLVMELCHGGELFDRIIEAGRFTEHEAANIMQQILRAVRYLHERDLCHRDLKPENFLFKTADPIESSVLKIIDFGLSCHSKPGAVHSELAGSAQYVAPQVLERKYDKMCDMWSCGVVMYTLLSGSVPFRGRDQEEVMAKVQVGDFSMNGRIWEHISRDAKDLIRKLLKMSPTKRYTAEKALVHDWIKLCAPRADNLPLEDGFLDNLRQFREKSKLKKAALHIIAGHLEDSSTRGIREMFTALDSKGDGTICLNELTCGLERAGVRELPPDLPQILEGVDINGTGVIDYTEFLAANLDTELHLDEDICRSAFSVFDTDGDGRISKCELTRVLDGTTSGIQEIGTCSGINFKDFMDIVRSDSTCCKYLEEPEGPSDPADTCPHLFGTAAVAA